MKLRLMNLVLLLATLAVVSACTISRKKPTGVGKVVVVKEARRDNGQHKGWYKNPNNPHHPQTTNPGHTKAKKAAKKGTAKKKTGRG